MGQEVRIGPRLYTVYYVLFFTSESQRSSHISDAATEPHHLWEYPSRTLTADFDLTEFDFTQRVPTDTVVQKGTVEVLG